jgi:hypothetical protein
VSESRFFVWNSENKNVNFWVLDSPFDIAAIGNKVKNEWRINPISRQSWSRSFAEARLEATRLSQKVGALIQCCTIHLLSNSIDVPCVERNAKKKTATDRSRQKSGRYNAKSMQV